MKKMLMLASVASMIQQFNMRNIHILQELGYEVHVACNFLAGSTITRKRTEQLKEELKKMGVPCHQIDFDRNVKNILAVKCAYRQVKALLQQEHFAFLHCHSPIGGVIGRLAGHACGVKVMYTAHGFHFFKGASIVNWMLFYPIERKLAKYTDVLLTMNAEDTKHAEVFGAGENVYIPGIGIDCNRFLYTSEERALLRQKYGYEKNEIILLSVGELSKRKNHEVILQALAHWKGGKIRYLIAGIGPLKDQLKKQVTALNLENVVDFLGYCEATEELYACADIFVFPSLQEGLPVALMEAMAAGLPVVISDIRGNVDLVTQRQGGYLCGTKDVSAFAEAISHLSNHPEERKRMGQLNRKTIQQFSAEIVDAKMKAVYKRL